MPRKISETKATCKGCGHVYFFGKTDELDHLSAQMDECGKGMMCCGGCLPAVFLPSKKATDPNRCPKCGSRAILKERITHEV